MAMCDYLAATTAETRNFELAYMQVNFAYMQVTFDVSKLTAIG